MTTIIGTPSTGSEQIQRAALYVLHKTINEAIGLVQAAWVASDTEHATVFGNTYIPTILEPIQNKNFHEGHRPSLINAPVDRYPNVAVMAYRATPAPGTDLFDHQENYRVSLAVEVMVKAMSEEGEEVCNRRAHRLVDAVHVSLMANTTLGGLVSGFDGTPTTSVTELFTRKDRGGNDSGQRGARTAYGPEWFWQGGRLEYAVRKEAAMPSHENHFRNAPTYSSLGIDQG